MSRFLYENYWGSPTLTLLDVLGVLNVLNTLKEALLAYWALFYQRRLCIILALKALIIPGRYLLVYFFDIDS